MPIETLAEPVTRAIWLGKLKLQIPPVVARLDAPLTEKKPISNAELVMMYGGSVLVLIAVPKRNNSLAKSLYLKHARFPVWAVISQLTLNNK